MVPAAGALLWALLLSLGTRAAAGAQGLTSTGTKPPASFRFRGPMTRNYRSTPGSGVPPKRRVIMEDEDDVVATADRLAGPAAAELLASTVSTDISRLRSWEQDEDGSLEEGVVINAHKNNTRAGTGRAMVSSTTRRFSSRFLANIQAPEYRMTTSLPPPKWRPTELSDTSLTRWSTAGSTPSRWPRSSSTAMPPPEDVRLVLMPWGPWHCHCKSGTMSRTRAGRLQGLSGRLRVGALSQLRTEHRPCTYHQCHCDRRREECPLDSGLCSDSSCTTQTTTTTTTTTSSMPHLSTRLRPTPFPFLSPSPSPALAFWRQVRTGLEDIWHSLSSVFTKMQPIDRNRR
ncbi:protein MENT [Molossus molossus]|uniref:Methylated in normal thymocytes n=1 Tax=Molossus molossus TaxID=27622 RepID=A0A7J8CPY9_MOLMO|nr:protein MENT [Molossus molossus]KAF6412819.1 methylated in normal thymocytes [Molossus molossus]